MQFIFRAFETPFRLRYESSDPVSNGKHLSSVFQPKHSRFMEDLRAYFLNALIAQAEIEGPSTGVLGSHIGFQHPLV